MVEKSKINCKECLTYSTTTVNVLARHVRNAHNTEWQDYIVKHEHAGKWPDCACKCGEKLPWKKGGFGKYIKGHDSKTHRVVKQLEKGWLVNPFTGREELINDDDEFKLLQHCIEKNDPVIHDHGIKVPWIDATGKIKVIKPSFKSMNGNVLLVLDTQHDPEYSRRSQGIRTWCKEHNYSCIIMSSDDKGFIVIGGYAFIR